MTYQEPRIDSDKQNFGSKRYVRITLLTLSSLTVQETFF